LRGRASRLMMSRALRCRHAAGLDEASLSLQTGQPILLPVEHGVTTATVTTPSGRRVSAPVTRGVTSFTETDEGGVYTVATARGETKAAVTLFNPDESELQPKALPTFVEGARPDSAPVPVPRELWQYLAVLVAFLLLLAGFLYWRRQTAGRFGVPYNPGDRWALGLRCVLVVLVL